MSKYLKLPFVFAFPCVVVVGLLAFFLFRDATPPEVTLFPNIEHAISPQLKMTVTVTDANSPIKSLMITVKRGDRLIPVVDKVFEGKEKEVTHEFSLESTGLKEGDIELKIIAVDKSFGGIGAGNKAVVVKNIKIDSVPLKVNVTTRPPNVRKGGTGVLAFTTNKDVIKAGVTIDNYFFPAFRQKNNSYICFFAFPYNMSINDYKPLLFVQDSTGAISNTPVRLNPLDQKFKQDSLNISQSFLRSKAEEFEAIVPGAMAEVERFKKINGPVRAACVAELLRIGKESTSSMKWSGVFLRLPKAASRAGFADKRTYMWGGEKIDEQTHLGFDLASTVNAPVPASNTGRVIYTAYLGIYGNLIVLDHGTGVQSLYSHLSKSLVTLGQEVKKGEIIAYTGKTGMAGGDHLHFGMMISGLEVTPLEWIDSKWIRDNITSRLNDASLKE